MPTTAKELKDQIELRHARFASIVKEVRAVLAADVPNWAAREAKEAFLGLPDAGLGDDQLKAYKAAVTGFGAASAQALTSALADEALWLTGAHSTETPRMLTDAQGVWANVVEHVDGPFNALLAEHGLGSGSPRAFRGPVYFVGGRYFPTLAEHYWKLRAELVELQGEADELTASETRAALLERWDSA